MQALSEVSRQLGNSSYSHHTHKLERINVLATTDLSAMFGYINKENNWIDGVFTALWRKSCRQQKVHKSTTWMVLDAPLSDVWCENIKSAMDDTRVRVLNF